MEFSERTENKETVIYTERGTRRRIVLIKSYIDFRHELFNELVAGDLYAIDGGNEMFTYLELTTNGEKSIPRKIRKSKSDQSLLERCKFILTDAASEFIENPQYDYITIASPVKLLICYSMAYLDNCKPAVRGEIDNNSVPIEFN
jgi:hypothetical protein